MDAQYNDGSLYLSGTPYGRIDYDYSIAVKVDASTGNLMWANNSDTSDWNSSGYSILYGDQFITAGYKAAGTDRQNYRIISYDQQSGKVNWDYSWGDSNAQLATGIFLYYDKIYIAGQDGTPWAQDGNYRTDIYELNLDQSKKPLSVSLASSIDTPQRDLGGRFAGNQYGLFFLGWTQGNLGGFYNYGDYDVYLTKVIDKKASPVIRGNSLYRIVDGPSWRQAENEAIAKGGHLVAIGTDGENEFLWSEFSNVTKYLVRPNDLNAPNVFSHWIGLTDESHEGDWIWSNGEILSYAAPFWGIWEGTYRTDENWARVTWNVPPEWTAGVTTHGFWQDHNENANGYETPTGIAEIPLVSSITFSSTAKEGQTLTTTISLSAGTQTTGNLAEGAQIWWKITGITADDLTSGELTGTGTIVNGHLMLTHKLKADTAIENESFQVSVFSDAAMSAETQIGSTASVAVEDSRPVIYGNSLYLLVAGPSQELASSQSQKLGGQLITIDSIDESKFVSESPIVTESSVWGLWIGLKLRDGNLSWYSDAPVQFLNWGVGEPSGDGGGINADIILWTKYGDQIGGEFVVTGQWNDVPQGWRTPLDQTGDIDWLPGIAEIPLTSSIGFSPTAKEGQTLTTTINLSAGTETTGNLAEGAQVWWKITGITADDLTSGDLTGTGTIVNGQLVLTHQLKVDRVVENESFEVSLFSDSSLKAETQIGSKQFVAVEDQAPQPITTIAEAIKKITLTSTNIDLTNSSGSIIGACFAIDPSISGITRIDTQWSSSQGNARIFSTLYPSGFDGHGNALFSGDLLFGKYYAAGAWKLSAINVVDDVNARSILNSGDNGFPSPEIASSISVTNANGDGVIPSLVSVGFSGSAASLDPSVGVTIPIIWNVADVGSGVESYEVQVLDPNGQFYGTFTDSLYLPPGSLEGEWKIRSARIDDRGANIFATYNPADFNSLGSVLVSRLPNRSPSGIEILSTAVNENIVDGTCIANVTTIDPDPNDTFVYEFAIGDGDKDNLQFAIDGGQLKLKSSPNFEAQPSYSFRLRATDQGGLSFEQAFTLTVNNLQEAGSLEAITSSLSGIFEEGVTLTAGALTDPDGITGAVTYNWYNASTLVQSGSSSTYLVGPQAAGTYRVEATYQDGTGASVTAISDNQVVNSKNNGTGTAGAITSSNPGVFQEGVTLTAGGITGDPDGAASVTGYQWYKDGALISGATSASYLTSSTGAGSYKVAITYLDGQNYSTTLTSATQAVSKIDNGNAVISVTGSAVVGSLLTAAISTPDPDGNGSFTYRWQSSSNGSSWSNILSNGTGSTYTLTSNELNRQVRVLVSSIDAQGYGPFALNSNATAAVVSPPDSTPPAISEIRVQGSTVILKFSEKIAATGISTSTFAIKVAGLARSVTSSSYDTTNQNQVTLTLRGTAPSSSQSVQVSYSGTSVKDLAGNSLGAITNRSADTFLSGSNVTSLYADYSNLTLTGTSAINGTGNAKSNTIIGNQANNVITGSAGADVLSGLGGTDTFTYTTLTDSLLGSPNGYTFDRIIDFNIGQDKLDGRNSVSASKLQKLGEVATLGQAGIRAVLSAAKFAANGAASFTYIDGSTERTFVALNDGVAGFDATKDAVVEITGYSGLLSNLSIV